MIELYPQLYEKHNKNKSPDWLFACEFIASADTVMQLLFSKSGKKVA